MQGLCLWFYKYGAARAHTIVRYPSQPTYFWTCIDIKSQLIAATKAGDVSLVKEVDSKELDKPKCQEHWTGCQVGPDSVFLVETSHQDQDRKSLMLKVDAKKGTYTAEVRTPDIVCRYKPCVAFDGDRSFYSISGYNKQSVSRYDIVNDEWTIDLANMKVARIEASACIFDSHLLYVLGG